VKKIQSLFIRNYDGDRLVRDEVVPGAEWVLAGEGVPTEMFDGTCCMVRDGMLFKRYDRKPNKAARRKRAQKNDWGDLWRQEDFKAAPEGWEPAEPVPNTHTGHWPGWVPVTDSPADRWHVEAWKNTAGEEVPDRTYELVGPRVQGNPHSERAHRLQYHGAPAPVLYGVGEPRTFDDIRRYLSEVEIEGIVWHHPDGRMAKIKRKDFGLPWPVTP